MYQFFSVTADFNDSSEKANFGAFKKAFGEFRQDAKYFRSFIVTYIDDKDNNIFMSISRKEPKTQFFILSLDRFA